MLHGMCYVDTIFHPKQARPVAEDDLCLYYPGLSDELAHAQIRRKQARGRVRINKVREIRELQAHASNLGEFLLIL